MSSKVLYKELNELKEYLKFYKNKNLLFIIDENVANLYRELVNDIRNLPGKKVTIWIAPSGESLKSFVELEKALEYFLESGVQRDCHLFAIGGGATSDFSGLVASLLLRGINWSVIPTTLLSMIDAAIGGKTAINSKFGKNLIGSFHLPVEILIDINFLKTLPNDHRESGLGEILKYGFLSAEISRNLLSKDFRFQNLVTSSAKYKENLVERDFKEQGERKLLNFGHTFGHAIEKHYSLSHGISVFWGMVILFILFDEKENLNLLKEYAEKIEYKNLETPWLNNPIEANSFFEYVKKDKKVKGAGKIDLIRAKKPGVPFIETMDLIELEKLFVAKLTEINSFEF